MKGISGLRGPSGRVPQSCRARTGRSAVSRVRGLSATPASVAARSHRSAVSVAAGVGWGGVVVEG